MYDNGMRQRDHEGDRVAEIDARPGRPAARPPVSPIGGGGPTGGDGHFGGGDPDVALVLAAGRGDVAAARQLVDRLLPPIVAFSARMLGDGAEAEDVAQEVFVKAWKAAPCWRPGGARFTTWLYRVAHNACIDRLRRRPASLPENYDAADERPGPEDAIEAASKERTVRQAVDLLPERQRAALALCYYEGLSNRQAADIMEITVEALESLLSRGRRALRTQLREADNG